VLFRSAKSYTGTATDGVGNSVTPASGSVTVDNTAPTGSITSPSNGVAGVSATVTANSADVTAGVLNVQLQYSAHSAGSWNTIATDTSAPYTTTWDTTALTDGGSYDLRAVTEDNASNTFTSSIVTVTVDRTAPAAPSTPVLAAASDSGVTGDNRTKVTTPTFTGTAEAGSTVTLFDGVSQVGSGTASGGNYSIATSALTNGSHTITATAADAAGNVSAASAGVTVTIDTVVPTVTDVTFTNGNVSGKMDPGDTITITYSEQLNASTFCSAWTSNSTTQTLSNATVTVTNSLSADTVTVSTASCTFHLGTIVGSDYVSANSTFTSSTLSWNPTTKVFTITMGTVGTSNFKTGVTAVAPKYTPDAALADLAANTMVASQYTDGQVTGF